MESTEYSHISAHPDKARVGGLLQRFEERFGRTASIVISVPGRVNLIGEHIDYCGYAVLPMAIEQSILVALAPTDSATVILENTKAEKYPKFECDFGKGVDIDTSDGPKWHNYFLCGVKGVLQDAAAGETGSNSKGMRVLIDGTIPPSAGLSSSSALVVAGAFGTYNTCHFNQITPTQMSFIKASEASRRYRGRGPGRDGSDDVVCDATPPTWMDQSGSNVQGVIWTYGRMHIYKISLIVQETGNFC